MVVGAPCCILFPWQQVYRLKKFYRCTWPSQAFNYVTFGIFMYRMLLFVVIKILPLSPERQILLPISCIVRFRFLCVTRVILNRNQALCQQGRKLPRLAVAGSRTQDTSSLSRQCSATEPWQPDNHQPSQSSICIGTLYVYRLCSTYRGLWGLVVVQLSVAQWQSTGSSSQSCPGFNSQPFHFPLFVPNNT